MSTERDRTPLTVEHWVLEALHSGYYAADERIGDASASALEVAAITARLLEDADEDPGISLHPAEDDGRVVEARLDLPYGLTLELHKAPGESWFLGALTVDGVQVRIITPEEFSPELPEGALLGALERRRERSALGGDRDDH